MYYFIGSDFSQKELIKSLPISCFDGEFEEQCKEVLSVIQEKDTLIVNLQQDIELNSALANILYNLGLKVELKYYIKTNIKIWDYLEFLPIEFSFISTALGLQISFKGCLCFVPHALTFRRVHIETFQSFVLLSSKMYGKYKYAALICTIDQKSIDFDFESEAPVYFPFPKGLKINEGEFLVVRLVENQPESMMGKSLTLLFKIFDSVFLVGFELPNHYALGKYPIDDTSQVIYLKERERFREKLIKKEKRSIKRMYSDKIISKISSIQSQEIFSPLESSQENNFEKENKMVLKKLLLLSLKQVGIIHTSSDFSSTWKTAYSACQFTLVCFYNF